MATLAVAAIGASMTASAGAAGLSVATTVALTAASMAAAYVDNTYIVPALFGDDKPEDKSEVGNLRLSTTNPGAPRYRVFGKQAMVPGHFLWNLNQRAVKSTTGGGSGKGATATQSTSEKFVDLGVALSDGPIHRLVRGYGNDTAFIGSEFNETVYAEHRLEYRVNGGTPYYGTATSGWQPSEDSHFFVRGFPSALSVRPFTEVFEQNDIVRLENVGYEEIEYNGSQFGGYFRVNFVRSRFINSSGNVVPTYMTLAPLCNQDTNKLWNLTPSHLVTGGTLNSPSRIRKMEQGVAGHSHNFARHNNDADIHQPHITRVGAGAPYIEDDGTALPTQRYSVNVNPIQRYKEVRVTGSPTTFNSVIAKPQMFAENLAVDEKVLLQGFCYPDGTVSTTGGLYDSGSIAPHLSTGTDVSRWPAVNWQTQGNVVPWTAMTSGEQISGQYMPPPVRGRIVGYQYAPATQIVNLGSQETGQYYLDVDLVEEDLINHLGDDGSWRTYRCGSGRKETCFSYFGTSYTNWDGNLDTATTSGNNLQFNRVQPGDWNTLEGGVGFTIYNTTRDPQDSSLSFRYKSDGAGSPGQGGVGEQGYEFLPGSDTQSFNASYQDSLVELGDIASGEDAPAFRGLSYLAMTNLNLYQFGNTIPRLRWVVSRAADAQTVGSVVKELVEEVAPMGSIDQGDFSEIECIGYTVGAGQSAKESIQPLSVAYGFHLQDRAGVMKMLTKKQLPYVGVPASHLNANLGRPLYSGLTISQEDERSMPKRLLIEYLNFGDGNEEAEGAGERAKGGEEAGKGDTLVMRVKPVVATYAQMKARAQELFDEITEESQTSATSLGPGYMDVMPGTVIGSVTNNWDDVEAATCTDSGFTFVNNGDVSMPIVPGSVYISMRVIFNEGLADESAENFVVTDTRISSSQGRLTGWPTSIYSAGDTLPTITYDAAAGADIVNWTMPASLSGDPKLDVNYCPSMSYRVDRLLTMRASKVTFNGLDMTSELQLVKQRYDGENLRPNFGIGTNTFKPLSQPVPSSVGLIPVDVPAIYGGQGNSLQVGLAAESNNESLLGAVVYESPNGTDQWEEVDTIGGVRAQGKILALDTLSVSVHYQEAPVTSHVDWSTSLILKSNIQGLTLESATREEISGGKNNLLIGDLKGGQQGEIIGFHEAEFINDDENEDVSYWLIKGIIRGLHKTEYACGDAYDNRTEGYDFVLLTDLGGAGTSYFTDPTGYTGGNRDRYFRAVPPGQAVASATTQTFPFKGASLMAPPPLVELEQAANGDVTISWWRRPFDQVPVFGMDTLPQGWYERYEVWAYDWANANLSSGNVTHEDIESAAIAQWVVGDQSQGSTLTPTSMVYTAAQQTADGISNLDSVGIVVYQVGPSGRGQRSSPYILDTAGYFQADL